MSGDDDEHDEQIWEKRPWAPEWSSVDRRDFLLTLGVAGAGAAAGCTETADDLDAPDLGASGPDAELNDQEQRAYEYWQKVTGRNEATSGNWGYEATQLNEYHERFPDRRGRGVDIAVIDTGFNIKHPLFNPTKNENDHLEYHINVDIENSVCISAANSDDCERIHDTDGHGTLVTGVAWQAAPNATYSIIRLKEYTTKNFKKSGEYVRDKINPDVISTSMGNHIFIEVISSEHINDIWIGGRFDELNETFNDAAQNAVVVSSSGQDKTNTKGEVVVDIPFPVHPSTAADVLSVSSTAEHESRPNSFVIYEKGSPDYSRNGKPDIAAPGSEIRTIRYSKDAYDLPPKEFGGSSAATPFVAGVAALLSDYGEPDEIREAILNSTWPVLEDPRDLSGKGAVRIMGAYNRLLQANTLTVDVVSNIKETPLAGATVTVNGQQKETNDGGEAYFDLKDDTYTVTVSYEGFEDIEDEVTIEGEDKRVLIAFDEEHKIDDSEGSDEEPDPDDEDPEDDEEDESSITIQLIDADTGEPITGGTVNLSDGRAEDPWGPEATDNNGVVTYEDIPVEGKFFVRGRAAGYAEQTQQFTWNEGDSVEITLELAPEEAVETSVLTVNVVYADTEEPGSLATVNVDRDGERVSQEVADDQGTAQFSLEDGIEYTVSAWVDHIVAESEEKTVTLDGDTEVTLALEAEDRSEPSETHVLTVNVLTAEVDPLHAYVRIGEVDTSEVAINYDGNFAPTWRFELENGTYTVEAIDPGDVYLPAERTVDIDGGDEEITVQLEPNEEHPGIEPENETADEDDEEEPSSADTRTVWVPDSASDSCSRMTVPADTHPDPAFETEEACLEYDGGFGGGEDTAEETPSTDDADGEGDPDSEVEEDDEVTDESDEPDEEDGTADESEGDGGGPNESRGTEPDGEAGESEEGNETDDGTSLTIDDPTD